MPCGYTNGLGVLLAAGWGFLLVLRGLGSAPGNVCKRGLLVRVPNDRRYSLLESGWSDGYLRLSSLSASRSIASSGKTCANGWLPYAISRKRFQSQMRE